MIINPHPLGYCSLHGMEWLEDWGGVIMIWMWLLKDIEVYLWLKKWLDIYNLCKLYDY